MDRLTPAERAHLGALESTFPGWGITVHQGVWRATRYRAVTPEQRRNGLHREIARPDPVALFYALCGQLAILVRMGEA
ncbi:hypothetical protein DP939_01550 [Spongiactinospora rosea]|uniref:Uncharacterized protein n=1 Tax=Spongiactinospora rosea TaxID=2248750 RepID=A0A366M5U7_9ACTN|nr:hypothetical protein [Spongiactinospora rosea]RBQ21427.1 hypothetical protein DP939_01550 [Spongiactinospora rosea]